MHCGQLLQRVQQFLRNFPCVALLGPRQSGKTTLARQIVDVDSLNYFDLEDPQSLARLTEPDIALRPLKGLVVIDEIQRRPDLFPLLRVLADRQPLDEGIEAVPLVDLVKPTGRKG